MWKSQQQKSGISEIPGNLEKFVKVRKPSWKRKNADKFPEKNGWKN